MNNDPKLEAQRQMIAARQAMEDRVKSDSLAGVQDDEASAITLLVERSRLVLYGSLASLGASLTAAWGQSRQLCVAPFHTALLLMIIAAALAWNGLQWAETFRHHRVTRKYTQLQHARHVVFSGDNAPPPADGALDRARKNENRSREVTRWLGTIGGIVAMCGLILVVESAMYGIERKGCWFYVVPVLDRLN
ncbi:hypothetical protein [Phenylobacterium sp.]|uniref:hypothetical protein n=1 Tax=Phenylobacterium sp. TaxID=1871053 RepID=UPI002DF2EE6E|nr:hypothetical protein [Phenylobacterium sp.]